MRGPGRCVGGAASGSKVVSDPDTLLLFKVAPDLHHDAVWTPEEVATYGEMVVRHGKEFRHLVRYLPDKTFKQIKDFWYL
jgi:hypothetical protein